MINSTIKIKKKQALLFAFIAVCFSFVFAFCLLPVSAVDSESNNLHACGVAVETHEIQYSTETIEIEDNLPERVDLSILDAFPPIGNQGSVGSCVSWATTYYQFTYEVAQKNNWNAKDELNKRFSPAFTFNYAYSLSRDSNSNALQDSSSMNNNYKVLMEVGSVRYDEFLQFNQYPWYKGNTEAETLVVLNESLKNRVEKVLVGDLPAQTNVTTPIIVGSNDSDLDEMKQLLHEKKCLVVIVPNPRCFTYKSIRHYDLNGYPYYTKVAISANDASGDMGTHAMAIVGYDDTVSYTTATGETIYGAFKLANSWGTDASNHENGFIWLMYDALNKVSAIDSLNTVSRVPAMCSGRHWRIEVANYTPQLTVEVTVQQICRKGFEISLGRSTVEGEGIPKYTFVDGTIRGVYQLRGFDGTLNPSNYQSYTFVFDYDAYNLYEGSGYHYWIRVRDLQAGDNKNTIVSKIVWKNKDGNVVYRITPNDALNGGLKRYHMALEEIEINKTSQRIQKGDTDTLVVTGAPADVVVSTSWFSDNPSCVTVTNGSITAVGIGTATVTATVQFESGVELYAECEYTVVEGYGASADEATVVSLYDVKNGELARAGDESWFKFTPTTTGRYLLYSVGGTSLVADMYTNTFDEVFESGVTSADNNDFVISKKLNAGQTYYIKLSGANDCCGAYTFCVASGGVTSLVLPENGNQDARHVRVSVSASSLYDTLKLSIGNSDFFFTKGNTSTLQGEINGARYKITFVDIDELLTTEWNIDIDISLIPSLVGEATTVKALFTTVGAGSGDTSPQPTLLAYESAFLAGVQVEAPNNLQLLLNGITETGYTYTVYGVDGNVITETLNVLAATGMKIVKKNAQNRIVKVYHVVVIGDVQGDGYINNIDTSWILQYDAGAGTLTEIQMVSADVNSDSDINNLDSAIILKYDAGLVDIDQQLNETVVPVGIYFGQPIGF